MIFFKKLFSSLDNYTPGYSGRKISTAISVVTIVYLSVYRAPESAIKEIIYSLEIFSSICLGLITVPDLIKFLSGKKEGVTEIKTESFSETTTEKK